MEQIKWPTSSIWFEDTLEVFQRVQDGTDAEDISEKIKAGEIFADKKRTSAKRVWGAIRARYFGQEAEKTAALAAVLQSHISTQEKQNYMFLYYMEYENLFRIFMEEYIYGNFNDYGQKTYTQMDLDKFFEDVLVRYRDYLPVKLQNEIPESSMHKVRVMLYKNLEAFGWGTKNNGKLTIRRPSLTPEWFTYLLYYFFDKKILTKRELYTSNVCKRFLLNEYDIDYFLTHAMMKQYIEINQLGDICNIIKAREGLLDYAGTYKRADSGD